MAAPGVERGSAHAGAGMTPKDACADVAVAVTGIAGPDGGSDDKPVGTVWFAWDGPERRATANVEHFAGDRVDVRRQTVVAALNGVLRQLADG